MLSNALILPPISYLLLTDMSQRLQFLVYGVDLLTKLCHFLPHWIGQRLELLVFATLCFMKLNNNSTKNQFQTPNHIINNALVSVGRTSHSVLRLA